MISTKGKSKEQVKAEAWEALQKYRATQEDDTSPPADSPPDDTVRDCPSTGASLRAAESAPRAPGHGPGAEKPPPWRSGAEPVVPGLPLAIRLVRCCNAVQVRIPRLRPRRHLRPIGWAVPGLGVGDHVRLVAV